MSMYIYCVEYGIVVWDCIMILPVIKYYSKTCLKWPLSKKPKMVFNANYRLMKVKSIAECSPWSILHYLRPSLSHHLSLRSLFCIFLIVCLRQVLLFCASGRSIFMLLTLCILVDFLNTDKYNKDGIVHYIFKGSSGRNFQIIMNFSPWILY